MTTAMTEAKKELDMEKLLKDQVAIITGGNAGIGKAIAHKFAEHGASVAIFGTNEERGKLVVSELQDVVGAEGKVEFFKVDVSNTQDVLDSCKAVLENFGKVDILVNNAGITRDNLLLKMSEEDWDAVLDVNLKSVFNTSKALSRAMMKARRGKIINISSVVGVMGNAGQANYAASKAGMLGLTKSLAKELASRNLCINCIAPGYIQTKMTEALTDQQKDAIIEHIPLRRLGQPEDIANAALFLASQMGDYVTGQVLTVDGGMVM